VRSVLTDGTHFLENVFKKIPQLKTMRDSLLPKNQIYLYENVINEKQMDGLKKIIDENAKEEEVYKSGSNVLGFTVHLSKLVEQDSKLYKYWDDIVFKTVNRVSKLVCQTGIGAELAVGDSGYQLRRIHGPTREHVDGIAGVSGKATYNASELRLYSMIIALNSDYEGGEFHFPEQQTIIKLKAGQAILFPPYWTHPHYTGELNGTFRYTINTWITKNSVTDKDL